MAYQASTPSTTQRSRESTAVLESSDHGTPAPSYPDVTMTPLMMTPAASVREGEPGGDVRLSLGANINKSKPFHSLMDTEIILEFGDELKERRVVHEELLRSHSSAAAELFDKVKPLRERYSNADKMRKDLKELMIAQVLNETFDERAASKKALPLIIGVYEHYPFKVHRDRGQQLIDEAITEQVRRGHVTSAQTKTQLLKDIKDMDIRMRANVLNASAILAVAKSLLTYLRSAKDIENKAALTNQTKAAAQGRYILPGFEPRIIGSLVQWLYFGARLSFDDAEHLYMLHLLAERLGISALAELCLCTLLSDAESEIKSAISRGLSLQQVLNFGSHQPEQNGVQAKPTDSSTQVIFTHVLTDAKPHERLVSLVTTTVAEHLDQSLWVTLAPLVNHSISMRLIQAMVDRQQVKSEQLNQLQRQHESALPDKKRARLSQHGKMEPK